MLTIYIILSSIWSFSSYSIQFLIVLPHALLQRVLEHCDDPKTQQIMMDEILQSVCLLAQDQYGNYVVQVSDMYIF